MDYICSSCKSTFDHNDIYWWTEPHGERIPSCPYCKGDIEDTHFCKKCGRPFCEDELLEGYCEECLKNKIDFGSFLEFGLDGFSEYETSILEEFMFEKVFGFDSYDEPKHSTRLFRAVMVEEYKRLINTEGMMDLIREFRRYYLIDFAGFLAAKEARECMKHEEQNTSA